MDDTTINAVSIDDGASGLSIIALIFEADIVVKLVMLILLLASLWCWAVIFEKIGKLIRLKRLTDRFEGEFWSGAHLDELHKRISKRADHPMALMFSTAMDEWREAPKALLLSAGERVVGRATKIMELTMDREIGFLEKNLSWLATIGATAPFVGLFGTVWGIMNSFQSIALTKNTTLAVVAPGIAEALFATALGLLAAIPAVIAYNRLSGAVDGFAERLSAFIEEFRIVLSRELDESRVQD